MCIYIFYNCHKDNTFLLNDKTFSIIYTLELFFPLKNCSFQYFSLPLHS